MSAEHHSPEPTDSESQLSPGVDPVDEHEDGFDSDEEESAESKHRRELEAQYPEAVKPHLERAEQLNALLNAAYEEDEAEAIGITDDREHDEENQAIIKVEDLRREETQALETAIEKAHERAYAAAVLAHAHHTEEIRRHDPLG